MITISLYRTSTSKLPHQQPGNITSRIFRFCSRPQHLIRTITIAAMAAQQQTSTLTKDLTLPGASSTTTTTPRLVYGTAWKKDKTATLVHQALKHGFRGIDTAAQPRHYQEALVGEGMRQAISEGLIRRSDLFLQTKYTPVSGQDRDNMPYDATASLEEQVHASVASSLRNLAVAGEEGGDTYLDSVVLHSPLDSMAETMRVWKALSTYVPHKIRRLGIANTLPEMLLHLCMSSAIAVKPAVVQNRFYRDTGYEGDMRRFCREKGIVFQTFWTLTGNPRLVKSAVVAALAGQAGVSREVAFYSLVLGLEGTTILDGTTSEEHMKADLEEVEKVGRWAEAEGKDDWAKSLNEFKVLIGEE